MFDLDNLENQNSIIIEKLKNLNHNINEQILVTDNEKKNRFQLLYQKFKGQN